MIPMTTDAKVFQIFLHTDLRIHVPQMEKSMQNFIYYAPHQKYASSIKTYMTIWK